MRSLDALFLAVSLVVSSARADITGTTPELGECLCLDSSGVNVRDGPCGPVIGTANSGECYQFEGNQQTCSLSGTSYEFFHTTFSNSAGWIAGDFLVYGSDAQCGIVEVPDTEHRSFFIATAWNVDWPDSSTETTANQQQQMVDYLNVADEMNMNAIVFQVRPAADAFYQSTIEPWSRFLTGTQGVAPSPLYDPLEFTVTEAHSRGMEVHAWLNPYRGNLSPNYDGLAANHICNTLRQYCYIYDNYLWLDPGASEVVDHLVNVITDIVTRYDVDGIHFDDYFYPYPDGPFPDDATYQDYLSGGGSLSLEDWRRDNVNRMVERVYSTIRGLSTSVKFSISPFGIYRPGHPEGMPPPIAGLDPYTAQFADPKLWFQSGWLDFIGPQLYWAIDPPAQSYPVLLDWWVGANTANRHIYVANGVYKMDDANDWPVSEIVNQVALSRDETRRAGGSLGNIHYSATFFKQNTKGIRDTFISTVNPTPATVPAMPWLGLAVPRAPVAEVRGLELSWRPAEGEEAGAAHTWAVYRVVGRRLEMLRHLPGSARHLEVSEGGSYVIRAVNRAGELSDPTTVHVITPNGRA